MELGERMELGGRCRERRLGPPSPHTGMTSGEIGNRGKRKHNFSW